MTEVNCFFDISVGKQHCGRLVFKLFYDKCPKTCENFRCLCTGERGKDNGSGRTLHYKGSTFHRVVRNFIIQGGDITDGNGRGGDSIYGGSFDDENLDLAHDEPYLLSMANRGPNTNRSQFFITTDEAPHLNGKHVVFGKLVSGIDIIHKIERLEVDSKSRPLKEVNIKDCGQLSAERLDSQSTNYQVRANRSKGEQRSPSMSSDEAKTKRKHRIRERSSTPSNSTLSFNSSSSRYSRPEVSRRTYSFSSRSSCSRHLSGTSCSSSISSSGDNSSTGSSSSSSSNSSSSSSSSSSGSGRSSSSSSRRSRSSSCRSRSGSGSSSPSQSYGIVNDGDGTSHSRRNRNRRRDRSEICRNIPERSESQLSNSSTSSTSSGSNFRSRKKQKTNRRLDATRRVEDLKSPVNEAKSGNESVDPFVNPHYRCSVIADEIPPTPVNRFLMRGSTTKQSQYERLYETSEEFQDEVTPIGVDLSRFEDLPDDEAEIVNSEIEEGAAPKRTNALKSQVKATEPFISRSGRIMKGRGNFKFRTPSPIDVGKPTYRDKTRSFRSPERKRDVDHSSKRSRRSRYLSRSRSRSRSRDRSRSRSRSHSRKRRSTHYNDRTKRDKQSAHYSARRDR